MLITTTSLRSRYFRRSWIGMREKDARETENKFQGASGQRKLNTVIQCERAILKK